MFLDSGESKKSFLKSCRLQAMPCMANQNTMVVLREYTENKKAILKVKK